MNTLQRHTRGRLHRGRPFVLVLLTGLLLFDLAGCAYSLKPGRLRPGLESIAVPYFKNESPEPEVEVQLTEAIIDGLIRDRTLRVLEETEADALVLGTIKSYNITEVFFGGDRQAEEYEVRISMQVSLMDRVTGEAVVEAKVLRGAGSYFIEDGPAGEEEAREEAAEELVQGILNLVVEEW